MQEIKGILSHLRLVKPPGDAAVIDEPAPCGVTSLSAAPVVGVVYCDHRWHTRLAPSRYEGGEPAWETIEECPLLRRGRIVATVDAEKRRLAGEIGKVGRHGGVADGVVVFDGYDTTRHVGADQALVTMHGFSQRPARNVLLVSPAGLGKTRLLLASHFALLKAGIASKYVTTPELRKWFRRAASYDEEVSQEAQRHLDQFVYAQAVHFDDAGHIEDDKRARGEFAEGLKDLLDRSRAAWAVATNRSSEEMEKHPDLSGTIASRFQYDADVVVMSGIDFRTETAR